ncbi:hypothetical protein [Lachnotalea glycerini]|uniref:Uncharacterized protein n=1 Tax=Lachnotalea glycerini TaxID=1763509 RepID=A0A371J4H6_9FIRM|nr:hypothetical protein [Lachnotalea glycerini]RDY27645.1 hypothetical protein CG710_020500 [Lachnotalea glycerini]
MRLILKNINIRKKYIILQIVAFTLDLIAAAFVAWGQHYFVAVGLVVVSIILVVAFYRCSHCGYRLDLRLKILENTHCPNCGEIILDVKNNSIKKIK